MEITEVRIKLMEGSEDRLRAFCSITIDQSFVIRDLKIIDGSHGPFVAMPSRKLTGHCNRCGSKNHLRATFCNQCGAKLQSGSPVDAPQKLYADVAHPINSECREMIQNAVVDEFQAELQRAAQPNYRSRYDDEFDAGDYDEADYSSADSAAAVPAGPNSIPPSATDHGPRKPAVVSSSTNAPLEEDGFRNAVPDSFGAGLLDSNPPTGDAATKVSSENDDLDDAIVVRGESGVPNSLPRPHFRDRPGPASRALVTSNPPSQGSRVSSDPEQPATPDDAGPENIADDSSFGAGIFDG